MGGAAVLERLAGGGGNPLPANEVSICQDGRFGNGHAAQSAVLLWRGARIGTPCQSVSSGPSERARMCRFLEHASRKRSGFGGVLAVTGHCWGWTVALPDGSTGIGRAEPVQTGKTGHEPEASRVARFLYRGEAEGTKMQTAGQQVALEARAPRKVVVVNGTSDVLELLESALDGGRYDLLFADAGQHAYSLIKREQPDLVVLSVNIDATEGFQL